MEDRFEEAARKVAESCSFMRQHHENEAVGLIAAFGRAQWNAAIEETLRVTRPYSSSRCLSEIRALKVKE